MFLTKSYSRLRSSNNNYFLIDFFKIKGLKEILNRRPLFSSEHLGIDSFKRQRFSFMNISKSQKTEFFNIVAKQFNKPLDNSLSSTSPNVTVTAPVSQSTPNKKIKNSQKTLSKTASNSSTFISSITFTEDLKLALNLAETNNEVDLVVEMARNYNRHKGEHLTYLFGPPLMRLLHLFNLPNLAFTLATLPEFLETNFFAQTSSRTIILDLLLDNHLHDQLWTVFSLPLHQQSTNRPSTILETPRLAADHVTILAASCYRQNTKESFERLKKIVINDGNTGSNIEASGRTVVYAGMLAYNQNEAELGLEIMKKTDTRSFKTTAYTNAMVLLLGKAGHHGQAVLLLQSMVTKVDVFQEVLDTTRALVTSNVLLSQTLDSLTQNLANTGSILPISFESYLNSVIRNNKPLQNSFKQSRISKPHTSRDYFPISKSRPGLR